MLRDCRDGLPVLEEVEEYELVLGAGDAVLDTVLDSCINDGCSEGLVSGKY